jgi:hypothetical protein
MKFKIKNYAQHNVIKTPAHQSNQQFKIPITADKTQYATFQGGLIGGSIRRKELFK